MEKLHDCSFDVCHFIIFNFVAKTLNPSDPDFEFEEFMILAPHDFVDVD